MGKYYLVGSYYNIFNKSYSGEVVLNNIGGINLSSLVDIDKFTSSYSNVEMFSMIEKELGIKGINHLAIKYMKNKKDIEGTYYRVIDNNKLFNNCCSNVFKQKINILGKISEDVFINKSSELYKLELEKLLALVYSGDFSKFREYYKYDNNFSFLVRRYMNSSYDNELEKEKDLELIKLEFSRYKTFRGWIVLNIKKKVNSNIVKSNKKMLGHDSGKILSIEENIELFEKKFIEKNGVSYDEYRTFQYNSDNEEFLDTGEMLEMFDYDNSKVVKRKR